MPGRQFSSPAWFWKQLCQNWTLSTKCFDVDESVNSNENLFSQNFSDQLYFLLPSLFTNSQTFCVAPGEGFLPGPSRLQTPVLGGLQAQVNTGTRPPGCPPLSYPHGRAAPSNSTALSLSPSPSIAQLHPDLCSSGGFVMVTKVPLPPFYSHRN